LPGWQRFYAEHRDDIAIVSIALEHTGAEAARPFVEVAGAEFPTAVDERGALSHHFDFKAVPNGILVDEAGIVRWAKFGGFSIDHPDDVAVVERFLNGDDLGSSPAVDTPYVLGPMERELVTTKVRLGQFLDGYGRRDEAVAVWREALRLDPENFTIRKQIWAAEHPEKFFPTIDFPWQGEQLRSEREREIAEGVCGPDGCPLPWVSPADR
jgi:hypothetical protein